VTFSLNRDIYTFSKVDQRDYFTSCPDTHGLGTEVTGVKQEWDLNSGFFNQGCTENWMGLIAA